MCVLLASNEKKMRKKGEEGTGNRGRGKFYHEPHEPALRYLRENLPFLIS
jgi:hypothetical protein